MLVPSARRALALALASVVLQATVAAQCFDWRTFPQTLFEINGTVRALAVHDDGSGPALYVGGDLFPPSGGATRIGVRRWDGTEFSDLAGGLNGIVYALAVYDDGSGPALYAGGSIAGSSNLVRWNGVAWQPVGGGVDGTVNALAIFDDGAGPALVAGGSFANAGGVPVSRIARWDGTAWSALGLGVSTPSGPYAQVRSLAVAYGGSGPTLYAGGEFSQAGGTLALNIARWAGGTWTAVGAGVSQAVHALAAWDDGGGPAVFAGGYFNLAGTFHGVLRWNGASWTPIGATSGLTLSLAVVDDGGGAQLYRGVSVCSTASIERWNGTSWSSIGPPVSPCGSGSNPAVYSFAVFDEGSGAHLFLGGNPWSTGPIQSGFSRRDGTLWERVGPRLQGPNGTVRALHVHADGAEQALYAAGEFTAVDDRLAAGIARWTGSDWAPLGFPTGPGPLYALATYDAGLGAELYAGGEECTLYRRRNGAWEFVAGSTLDFNDRIQALAVYDAGAGPELFVGGTFTWFGGVPCANIVRCDGVGWHALTSGVAGDVRALQVFDDGGGPELYVGGSFLNAGGISAARVARWDGSAWSPTGSGFFSGIVEGFAVHDSGAGAQIYAAGSFAGRVSRWNGNNWQPLANTLNGEANCLASFDDGTGPALYAGGLFTAQGALPLQHVARWSGAVWSGVGAGVPSGYAVYALGGFDDGTGIGPELGVGGAFAVAGTQRSRNFATWRACAGAIARFCFGDGSVAACPCANQGLSGRGCENSALTGGARLNATGAPAPDTIVLHAAGELPSAATLFFQGSSLLSAPLAFGDGLRCVSGAQLRLYTTAAVGGAVSVPGPGQPSVSARSAALGDVLVPGAVRGYQAWYRDPSPSFCAAPPGTTWNLSNAVRIQW